MIFNTGKVADQKVFKWLINDDHTLSYVNNRAESEVADPPQYNFEWLRATRDMHVSGRHPHISIDDRLFVECIGGDLTIKVENNTDSGKGIVEEPVENSDQTLDDAHIHYAILDHLILLKIRPFREEKDRYFIYNERLEKAQRVDDLAHCGILLPGNDGMVFPSGSYLSSGDYKSFSLDYNNMQFIQSIESLNGEDYLFVFHEHEAGEYILVHYNLIKKTIETPITCHGYAIYDNGHMVLFSASQEPMKSHGIQIWQTPFVSDFSFLETNDESPLTKIGNKSLVAGIADLRAIFRITDHDEVVLGEYNELVRMVKDTLDYHFWLKDDFAKGIKDLVHEIGETGNAALNEYEKVIRIKAHSEQTMKETKEEMEALLFDLGTRSFSDINVFIKSLTELNLAVGKVIGLEELQHTDINEIKGLEEKLLAKQAQLTEDCSKFLLTDEAMNPFVEKVDNLRTSIEAIERVKEVEALKPEIEDFTAQIDTMTNLIQNLETKDASDAAAIIERVSSLIAQANQVKAMFRNKSNDLQKGELTQEFRAQYKLLTQTVTGYIDQATTPKECDEFLNKVMMSLETLEGKFGDFPEFIEQISEKREEYYSIFNSKKIQLEEARNRKSEALLSSAQRILTAIKNRSNSMKTVEEINAYFASDQMVKKVKSISKDLSEIGDNVRSDGLISQLKTIQQDGVRQIKDKKDLFADGDDIISFGKYKFQVSNIDLDLTIVQKDHHHFLHINSTDFFEQLQDERLDAHSEFWDQILVSETKGIYRGEYLAYHFLQEVREKNKPVTFKELTESLKESQNNEVKKKLIQDIQSYMSSRLSDGYEKGIHDEDCYQIIRQVIPSQEAAGELKFSPEIRGYGNLFLLLGGIEQCQTLAQKIGSWQKLGSVANVPSYNPSYLDEIIQLYSTFADSMSINQTKAQQEATARYLFNLLGQEKSIKLPLSKGADQIIKDFDRFIKDHKKKDFLSKTLKQFEAPKDQLDIVKDWLRTQHQEEYDHAYDAEILAFLLMREQADLMKKHGISFNKPQGNLDLTFESLQGAHPKIKEGALNTTIFDFTSSIEQYISESVPQFHAYLEHKHHIIEERKAEFKLHELKPKILGSFVRNKLINDIYLPKVGMNLAKQIGTFGDDKRTDLMGLLLLISPPGYGKTTLMEYIAERLGLIFMKINGPALGHDLVSLDPEEAPNATARNEVERLNLAFEMGNNVMIYLDDIQHCNPELLQKFISLCDGQRKIEGVWKGQTKTYDLRGKRVSVVMAGNPYTETGEKFRIPDMLANRADIYNLGDMLSGSEEAFKMSYLENALTSHSVLSRLGSKSQKDIYQMVKVAETGSMEGIEFESKFSMAETNEFTAIFTNLIKVRDIVLKVNLEYIASAAKDEKFRTEPPFLLQGSYRNMNKIAPNIAAIMNEEEVLTQVLDHYKFESQLLTTGAEFNVLKFLEMIDQLSEEQGERLAKIREDFQRSQRLGGNDQDGMTKIIGQLDTFNRNFEDFTEHQKINATEQERKRA